MKDLHGFSLFLDWWNRHVGSLRQVDLQGRAVERLPILDRRSVLGRVNWGHSSRGQLGSLGCEICEALLKVFNF